MRKFVQIVAALVALSGPALACGPDSDCVLGDRLYRIRMPAGASPAHPVGAILFAHGFGGKAADIMADSEFGEMIERLGVALIAPQSAGVSWASQGSPFFAATGGVGEIPYLDNVLSDAAARFPIDRTKLMAAGVSAGGMLVWTVACHRGDLFAGYLAFAGTLWSPQPETCPSRPDMLRHIHARADPVVPLEGGPAPIAGFEMGDVYRALDIVARDGGFGPAVTQQRGGLACEMRGNARGAELSLCLHDGGHEYRVEDVEIAWRDLARRAAR